MNHFVNIADVPAEELRELLAKARADKALFARGELPASLTNRTLAMIFEKPSLRTRVSFEAAMTQLGGHAIYLAPGDIGLGTREPVQDVARVLSGMCDGIMARTFAHETVEQLAAAGTIPVVNALSDYSHPCQAMADFMTVAEQFGDLAGRSIVFVGDGNNVARSLAILSAKLGVRFTLACPAGYELEAELGEQLRRINPDAGFTTTHDARDAVASADVVYADTWVSMGQEEQKREKIRDFEGFQVNAELLSAARSEAIALHCLPAYRGVEISEETFEAHAEPIFRQASNRLHFQRSLLDALMG